MMVNDCVKIFYDFFSQDFEDAINEWLSENPDCYIRNIEIRSNDDGKWVGFIWYTKINLEEEQQ